VEGEDHWKGRRFSEAASSLRRGLDLAERLALDRGLTVKLRERMNEVAAAKQDADRDEIAREFGRLADALRFVHGADWQLATGGAALADRCAALWQKRADLLHRAGHDAKTARSDLLDVVLLWTDVRLRLAPAAEQDDVRREALAVLREAEALLGPSHALYRQVEWLATALGRALEAADAAAKADSCPPRTAWEHYVVGRQLLLSATGPNSSATLNRAAAALEESLRLQPHALWSNYCFGHCAYRTGRLDEAIRSFSTCIGAAPDAAEWFACRALAYAALGQAEPALRDYAYARRLQPAAVCPLAAVHYNLAVAHAAKANLAAARQHVVLALRDDPQHAGALALLQKLR
jgi:tetratricopeptide (TPR) repeat protein